MLGEVRGAQTDVTAQAADALHVTSRHAEERKVDSTFRENIERCVKPGERVGLPLQPESCAWAATLLPDSLWACNSTAAQQTHAKQAAGCWEQAAGCWKEEQVLAACAACGRADQGGLGNNTAAEALSARCEPCVE